METENKVKCFYRASNGTLIIEQEEKAGQVDKEIGLHERIMNSF